MMLDKNRINFLQFREEILDISPLEEKYQIKLPPIYRAFITTFKTSFANQYCKIRGKDSLETITAPIYSDEKKESYNDDDDELAFERFKEPEEALKFKAEIMKPQGWAEDMMFIAEHAWQGGLLLGIAEHNADKIFEQVDGEEITFMANNIFELINDFHIVFLEEDFPQIDTNKLYRNSNEDFWRIKEGIE